MSTAIYHRCVCPHCQQDLEYPSTLAAQVIDCPMCAQPLTLPAIIAAPPPRSLFQRFKEAGQAVLDKRNLKNLLLESVKDGVLTAEEEGNIHAAMAEAGMDRSVLTEWREEIMARAVDSITHDNVSMARVQSVDAIRDFLTVSEADLTTQIQRLARWRYIASIRQGTLPVQEVQNFVLRKGEQVHWVEPAKLWEERVVSRRYEGGSSGVSFRIARGITIRTGATRGQMVSATADVAVSEGRFIVTSDRLVFSGQVKSFETKYEKILDIHNHFDGIQYSESNKQKPRKIQYYSSNGDIIVEILSQKFTTMAGV